MTKPDSLILLPIAINRLAESRDALRAEGLIEEARLVEGWLEDLREMLERLR